MTFNDAVWIVISEIIKDKFQNIPAYLCRKAKLNVGSLYGRHHDGKTRSPKMQTIYAICVASDITICEFCKRVEEKLNEK